MTITDILRRFDELVQPNTASAITTWLDRIVFVFLVLMVLAAPHSIAATQIAWLTGMAVWVVRLAFKPRVKFKITPLDIALLGFLAWSVISAAMSYDPPTSFDRLRVVALLFIFYFVFYNVRNLKAACFLAFALIFSCMVNVAWTPVQKWLGRGIEVHGLAPNSPLAKAGVIEGDTLDRANGKKLNTPEDALVEIAATDQTTLEFYRGDFETDGKVDRFDLLTGNDAKTQLGFTDWKRGSIIRASGFYRHYVTYAEVLQLIASLAFGLFVAAFTAKNKITIAGKTIPAWTLFGFVFACMGVVLLMTVTRASQAGLALSGLVILIASGNRRLLLVMAAVAIPIGIAAVIYLQQQRHVGVVDTGDEGTQYREMMWRDGVRLWTSSPRNFVFGVGMDSIKSHWREWDMFEGGRWPVSHFHSMPVQLLAERGLPALLLWLAVLALYARTLWQALVFEKRRKETGDERRETDELDSQSAIRNPQLSGLLLGCLGGLFGFFLSGLVHYNLGDSVVAMVFFLIMGLGISGARLSLREAQEI